MGLLGGPWVWGLGGAIIYAAPRLSTCLFASRESGTFCKCWVDATFALVVGPIAAAAFTGDVQSLLGVPGGEHIPAVSALIGLLANPVAPGAVEVLTGGVLERLRIWLGGRGK